MSQSIGDLYAQFQLAKALSSGASGKVAQWREVLAGMRTGDLRIGDRAPVIGMPVWATPEIVRGGFATGAYAAGGALRPHELALAETLNLDPTDTGRLRSSLNLWHLSDPGLARLRDMAESGCFETDTPEESALLAVALLAERAPQAADAILDAITPFFDRLRFYPVPANDPRPDGVFVQTIGDLRRALARKRPSDAVRRQEAALTLWIPLYDRLVDLLSEPVTEDWFHRANTWLQDYRRAEGKDMARRWARPDGPFQSCRAALEQRCHEGPLSAEQERYVSLVIERRAAKYGRGEERDAYRADQARQNVEVWLDALAAALLARLEGLPGDRGVEDVLPLLAPIAEQEARPGAKAGSELLPSFARKVSAVQLAPVSDLVRGGQIASPEVLAAVLPQITANLHARGFADPATGTVFASLYRSFRLRRSLLLLDLQSQIQLPELPWAAALLEWRKTESADRDLALAALREIATLALEHFSYVQFPNSLTEEMLRLAQRANLPTPFTRELAADIFMGEFSETFEKAAALALKRYAGTLYARYYDLPAAVARGRFAELCFERAGARLSGNRSVAWNGMVIEQQLILTTHNLAAVFDAMDLSNLDHGALARQCFDWICRRLQRPGPDWRSRLQGLKNAAYAWRQMIVFLSELDADRQSRAWAPIEETFAAQPEAFRGRFDPAMIGLRNALTGAPPDANGGRAFLGWALDRHPFAEPRS